MQLDHNWIAERIPHRGSMCLLDRVLHWDDTAIRCSANGHRDHSHPLRAHGRLSAACGIEYAAQAMAVHGALRNANTSEATAAAPRMGMLASVRGVELRVARLDDIEAELLIEARRVAGDLHAIGYEFTVRAGERELLSGRATVILDVDATGIGGVGG